MVYRADANRYAAMPYHRPSKSGLKLSALSLGFWHNFGTEADMETMQQMCHAAFDNGITCFDLANNYGPEPGSAEENLGRILHGDMHAYRDELVVTTKAGYIMWDGPYGDGGSRKYLLSSLDRSLKRLQLDYVDIFYHHRMDKETPVEESMMALDQAVRSGRALYAGISNYDSEHTKQAAAILTALGCPFVVNQVRYSMFDRHIEKDFLPECCKSLGVGIVAFSPLAQGLLTDKYLHGIPENSRIRKDGRFLNESHLTPARLSQIAALNEIAAERGQKLSQMALSWVLHNDAVTSVLIGASGAAQIRENVQACSRTDFSAAELQKIEAILA